MITDEFHYTSQSAKPSTTGTVQVVCASSQWDACLTTNSERKFSRGTGQGAHQFVGPALRSSSAVFTELSSS